MSRLERIRQRLLIRYAEMHNKYPLWISDKEERRKWWVWPCSGGRTSGAQRDSQANPEVTCGIDLYRKIKIKYMVHTIGRNVEDLNDYYA